MPQSGRDEVPRRQCVDCAFPRSRKATSRTFSFTSHTTFGESARRRYETLIEAALHDIVTDPDRVGVRQRGELGPNIRTYHLFHSRENGRTHDEIVREPRHMLVFRLVEPNIVDVGRILHDAMEVANHLPTEYRSSV